MLCKSSVSDSFGKLQNKCGCVCGFFMLAVVFGLFIGQRVGWLSGGSSWW